jgi:uncharacterized protein YerC
MIRKTRVTFTAGQKLEYAKLMINEGYTNKQIRDISGAGNTAVSRWKKQCLAEVDGHTSQAKKSVTPGQHQIQKSEKL